jgi:hypothetical protein
MHLNFAFTAVQTLWTLTFAALLVLLVVLLGRDRAKGFPWFTGSIALVAVRLLASRLLAGRLSQITMAAVFITLADIAVVVGYVVLVELVRRSFAGAGRRAWIAATLGMVAVGGVVLATWGPWPAWKTLTAGTEMAALQLMQLAAQKGELLLNVVTVELGLLVVLLGQRFKAGWRSHAQRIAIGLSTVALAQIAVQGIWQLIAIKAIPHSRDEYERILGLRDKLFNANSAVFIAVLVWWIACLWMDEPGAAAPVEENQDAAAGELS